MTFIIKKKRMDLIDFKTTFDGILQGYVDEKILQSKHLLASARVNEFVQYVQTFIFSGGKRIRPYVLWAIYMGLWGEKEKEIFQFGIIFELLHTMALVHDDIMDQSDKRHNALTIHAHIETLLWDHENRQHVAQSQAILIGDLLLAWVYELRYKIQWFDQEILDTARLNVHSMIEEVILGQMIDVDMTSSAPADMALIDKKNTYKTASYTFVRPMLTWAILAWADLQTQNQIADLWLHLGLAFQVRDDLMDITWWDKTKSAFSDVQEGQQTYFTHYVFTHGTDPQKQLLQSCLGKKLDVQQIHQLQLLFQDVWAIDRGRQQIAEHLVKANEIFAQIPLTNLEAKESFARLIKKMEK